MRKTSRKVEEVLEAIWTSTEAGDPTLTRVRATTDGGLSDEVLANMQSKGLVSLAGSGEAATVALTLDGRSIAARVMRSHRLAERLVCDVLGASLESIEAAACEFEHTLSAELTDSICTLLGHPRFCPHGKSIPEGDCCRQTRSELAPVVVPSTQLAIGEEGRVAYVGSDSTSLAHQLASLGIAPGVPVRLHQRFPSFVLKCEETEIAVEEAIAANIYVRREGRR
jgi:DtxR family Mn-dependent transcriptional regulator